MEAPLVMACLWGIRFWALFWQNTPRIQVHRREVEYVPESVWNMEVMSVKTLLAIFKEVFLEARPLDWEVFSRTWQMLCPWILIHEEEEAPEKHQSVFYLYYLVFPSMKTCCSSDVDISPSLLINPQVLKSIPAVNILISPEPAAQRLYSVSHEPDWAVSSAEISRTCSNRCCDTGR